MGLQPSRTVDAGHDQRSHPYDPQKWRVRTFPADAVPDVRSHWHGVVPDPEVSRRIVMGPGDVNIPRALLTSGLNDVRILLWTQIRSWFHDEEGEASYSDLASALLGPEPTPTRVARIGRLLRPMIGTWILRRRAGKYRWLYRTGEPFFTADPWGGIRAGMLEQLAAAKLSEPGLLLRPADLVSFARWRMECGGRGWTIESSRRLAQMWGVTTAAAESSRSRLTQLGWLLTLPRSDNEGGGDLVWITEQYDPQQPKVEITDRHRDSTKVRLYRRAARASDQPPAGPPASAPDLAGLCDHLHANFDWHVVALSFAELEDLTNGCTPDQLSSSAWWEHTIASRQWARATRGRTTHVHLERREVLFRKFDLPRPQTLDTLRHGRVQRRRRAYADLLAPQRTAAPTSSRWQPHEVYLLHFPAERCFKVGIARSGSGRVAGFLAKGGTLVERIEVASGLLAEIVEADVLILTEEWHRLGDRNRVGGGYTEMWSESGPTVDLKQILLLASARLARLQQALDEGSP